MKYQNKNFHMVKLYDKVIPDNACKSLINLFEYNKEHQEYINEDHCPCFTQININQISTNIVRGLIPTLQKICLLYTSDAADE